MKTLEERLTSPIIKREAGNQPTSPENVKREINEWPSWKKDAYNNNFATSIHAEKLQIG